MNSNDPPEPPRHASNQEEVALVVLAAGYGTRMRSSLPKPLHPVAGLPMVRHVLDAGSAINPAATVLVVNPSTADLAVRLELNTAVSTVIQDPPRGTGDAMRLAMPAIGHAAWVVMLFADHPLLTGETVHRLIDVARAARPKVAVLSCVLPDAAAYGRIDRDDEGRPVRIVERKADLDERRIGPVEINSGMMALDAAWAQTALERLTPNPASNEYYLTDLVELAIAEGPAGPNASWPVATVAAEPEVALGINDRVQLAEADTVARERIKQRLMRAGVTLIGPESIFIDNDVLVGPDTTILPFTVLRGATVIGARCEIGPHATLEDARLGDEVIVRSSTIRGSSVASESDVGPYAHLRGGTVVGSRVHIGNYAELKNATIGDGVKVGHVSYLGDASVGKNANIGAGTITANYDGVTKQRTDIGAGAFIGCDSMLIAPVRVGDNARTGAGAVVTRDVPDGATVVGMPARMIRQRSPGGPEPHRELS